MIEVDGEDNYLAELAAQIVASADADGFKRIILEIDATSPVAAALKFRRVSHRRKQQYYASQWLDTLLQNFQWINYWIKDNNLDAVYFSNRIKNAKHSEIILTHELLSSILSNFEN